MTLINPEVSKSYPGYRKLPLLLDDPAGYLNLEKANKIALYDSLKTAGAVMMQILTYRKDDLRSKKFELIPVFQIVVGGKILNKSESIPLSATHIRCICTGRVRIM